MHYAELVINGLTLGSIYALVAIGFHLVYRVAGVLDFAQGDKVVLGGLLGLSLVRGDVPIALSLGLVAVLGLGLGLLYDGLVIAPTRRNGEIAAISATVGAMLVIANGQAIVWGANQQPFPALARGTVEFGKLTIATQSFVIWATVAGALALLVGLTRGTRTGKGMIAAASDPLAATALGISVPRARRLAFSLAFGFAAVAGVLIAPLTLAGGALGTPLTLKGFTGAILGGLESPYGVVVGALALGVFENVVADALPNGYRDPVVFGALLAVLLVMPTGLFGLRRDRVA